MVPLPQVKNVIENEQYALVREYCENPFWQEQYDRLFDEKLVVDFPHAPPGFYQHFSAFEFGFFRYWLRNIIIEWQPQGEPTIIQTKDPNVLWAVYFSRAKMKLAKRPCDYHNEHAVRFTIRDGRIAHIKDYFNPLRFYDALDIRLPAFVYDPVASGPSTRMPPDGKSKFTLEQNMQRAFANFANPIDVDGDPEPIYAEDVLEVCPNAPYSMTETYSGASFDVQTEWMFRTVPEWNSDPNNPSYEALDPDVIVVESDGYGHTLWSGEDGHYCQRELQIVFLSNGKVKHFRVYFNPLCKFHSMNQSIPSIPFMNF